MIIAKRIGIFFLLLTFLFSTIGISIHHHVCNSSRNDEVTVYPELFKRTASCCEADEADASVTDHSDKSGSSAQSIDAMPCCINVHSFLKLQFISEHTEKCTINPVIALFPQYHLNLPEPATVEFIPVPVAYFQFYSPPLFGKRLIHFLHQIKVPSPSSQA